MNEFWKNKKDFGRNIIEKLKVWAGPFEPGNGLALGEHVYTKEAQSIFLWESFGNGKIGFYHLHDVEHLRNEFLSSRSPGYIADTCARYTMKFMELVNRYPDTYKKHDIMKEQICQLINTTRNENLLEKVPHIRMDGDISMVFYLPIFSEGHSQIVMIDNEMITDIPDFNLDMYKQVALANTKSGFEPLIRFLSSGDEGKDVSLDDHASPYGAPMLVISSKHLINGSIFMEMPDILERASNLIGADLFILPSSINELIAVRKDEECRAMLLETLHEINKNPEMQPEQLFLSDSMFSYSRKDGMLRVA